MSELKGICTPVCTPFFGVEQALDESALCNHLDSMLEAGIHIIAVCGGTGEFPFLSTAEKRRITELSARHIDGRAKLIVQTSMLITAECIEASQHAEDVGADTLLVLPPYFEGPGEDGVIYHYERVAAAVKIPIMAYNIPVHSGFHISPELFSRLREIDNIQYLKDSTGDMAQLERLVLSGAQVFNGCDYLNPYSLMAGCVGCFWGGSNAMPVEAVQLYDHCVAGRYGEALTLWDRMKTANLFFWQHNFNAAVKAATNMSGRTVGEVRKPVHGLDSAQSAELETAMSRLRTQ